MTQGDGAAAEFVDRVICAGSRAELQRLGLVDLTAHADQIARELAPLWDAGSVRIIESRVNGNRIDARLESDDGRAWLAVLWSNGNPASALADAIVYERPQPFRADGLGTVIVLNGPSSVGKSSLMAAFADAAPTPWAGIDEPMFGRLSTKFLAWPSTAGPVPDGFLAALAAAARIGNQFIVSAGGIDQARFRTALNGLSTVYVGLDAPLDILLARQVTQVDKFGGLAEESVGIHEGWKYDLRLDTATNTPEAAARLLIEFLVQTGE